MPYNISSAAPTLEAGLRSDPYLNTAGALRVSDTGAIAAGAAAIGIVQPGYVAGTNPITGASGNVANASAVATLAGTAGKTTYISGFAVTSTGATAASVVLVTVAGTISGSLIYVYASVAGATSGNAQLILNFALPIPASAANTAITVTLPALGAGNTNAAVVARGFQA